jgi:hypothetical protein
LSGPEVVSAHHDFLLGSVRQRLTMISGSLTATDRGHDINPPPQLATRRVAVRNSTGRRNTISARQFASS